MGCLSSKMASKTLSFRGDQDPKNRFNDLSVLDDMLKSSNTKRNRLLALLYTANTVVLKLKAEEQENGKKFDDLPNKVTNHAGHDTVNTWELMAGLKEEEHEEQQHDEQMKGQEAQEDNCSLQIEVIHVDDFLSSSSDDDDDYNNDVWDDDHGELVVKDCENKVEESDLWEESRSQVAPPPQGQEDRTVKSEATEASVCTDLESVTIKDIVGSDSMRLLSNGGGGEVGWREEVARDHELNEEFRISSFRFLGMADHLHGSGDEEESLSGYITPRFGSYVESKIKQQMKAVANGEGGGILHDELVAQLEEAMKQMTDEEEHVLMKIVEDFMEQVL